MDDVIPHAADPLVQIRPGPTRFDPDPNRLEKKKKKVRENILTKKIKNFKTDLSHSIFRVHSDFGTHFFIRGSKIVQTSNFQKGDFCANVQTSKFLRWTYLAQFFVYILILESVPSFETRKLYKWLKFQDN